MKKCVICERKSVEIQFGEGAKGDRRKLIIYGTEKIIHICQPCRLFMGCLLYTSPSPRDRS